MTPQQNETAAAKLIFSEAQAHASDFCHWRDIEAQTIAILLAAFELATQSMSQERRNALLRGETE